MSDTKDTITPEFLAGVTALKAAVTAKIEAYEALAFALQAAHPEADHPELWASRIPSLRIAYLKAQDEERRVFETTFGSGS